MGWEHRGANQYYYRKEREGARVKSVYVGRGEIAHLVSDLQDSSGLFDEAISIAYPSEQEKFKEEEVKIDQACDLITAMMHASLLSAGFHLHRRQWRRKRNGNSGQGRSFSEDKGEVR